MTGTARDTPNYLIVQRECKLSAQNRVAFKNMNLRFSGTNPVITIVHFVSF